MSETDIDIAVAAKLDQWGVHFTSTYLRKEKREGWECYAWDVAFQFRGATFSTAYYMGTAHATKRNKWADEMKPTPPTAARVLYSLLLDSQAVHQSFDDWCFEYDSDPDSLKARKTYDECSDIGKRFYKMFDATLRAELSTLLENY